VLLAMMLGTGAAESESVDRIIFGFEKTFVPASPSGRTKILIASRCDFPSEVDVRLTPFHDTGGSVLMEGAISSTRITLPPGKSIALEAPPGGRYVMIDIGVEPGPCVAPGRIAVAAAVLDQVGGTSAILRAGGAHAVESDAGTGQAQALGGTFSGVFYVGEAEHVVVGVYNGCSTATVTSTITAVNLLTGASVSSPIVLGPGEFGIVEPELDDRVFYNFHHFHNAVRDVSSATCSAQQVVALVSSFTTDGTIVATVPFSGDRRIKISENNSPIP
jgi:hypothetical protein